MERDERWWQPDLLVHSKGATIQDRRLDALNRAEVTRLLRLLLNECVAGAARVMEAANEQDHA